MPSTDEPAPPASQPATHKQAWAPSRGQRFGLWIGGVALTLGSPLLPLVVLPPHSVLAPDAIALAGLGLLLLLLATTPADAIKLPRWASWLIIALGSCWMIGMRLAPPGLRNADDTTTNSIAGAMLLGSVYTAIVLLAIAIAWGVRQVTNLLRPAPKHTTNHAPSPWRVVLYAWHPALPMVAAASIGLVSEPRSLVAGALAGAAILLAALAADLATRQTPRLTGSLALFAASAVMVLVVRLAG